MQVELADAGEPAVVQQYHVKKLSQLTQYYCIIEGGSDIVPLAAGTAIQSAQQIMVSAPTGNKIRVNAKSMGKARVIAMKKDTFPLQQTTDILGASDLNDGESELVITAQDPKGCVLYIIGDGKVEVNIDSDG